MMKKQVCAPSPQMEGGFRYIVHLPPPPMSVFSVFPNFNTNTKCKTHTQDYTTCPEGREVVFSLILLSEQCRANSSTIILYIGINLYKLGKFNVINLQIYVFCVLLNTVCGLQPTFIPITLSIASLNFVGNPRNGFLTTG